MKRKVRGQRATLSSPGGVTRSLIWESLTPSAYRRSRERRSGQPEEQRAETDDQEQPASIKSFSPAKLTDIVRLGYSTNTAYSKFSLHAGYNYNKNDLKYLLTMYLSACFVSACLRTRQAANEPVQLLFRDVGPREIESNRLSLYNAC